MGVRIKPHLIHPGYAVGLPRPTGQIALPTSAKNGVNTPWKTLAILNKLVKADGFGAQPHPQRDGGLLISKLGRLMRGDQTMSSPNFCTGMCSHHPLTDASECGETILRTRLLLGAPAVGGRRALLKEAHARRRAKAATGEQVDTTGFIRGILKTPTCQLEVSSNNWRGWIHRQPEFRKPMTPLVHRI